MPNRSVYLVVCALAGALAVPPHPLATPIGAAVFALLAWAGLWIWRWSGLTAPMRSGSTRGTMRAIGFLGWFVLGLAVGLVVLGVLRLALQPVVPDLGARIAAAGDLPLWRRAIIIYVAAVGEELIFRLLLLSAVAGIAARLLPRADRRPTPGVTWAAITVSAFLFAAVHLQAWSAAGVLSTGVALSVLALNMFGGLVLGRVFIARGIVAAMWVHAGADAAIQIVGPLTG
jgi:membrane protease YdiL (CAAX protease family)